MASQKKIKKIDRNILELDRHRLDRHRFELDRIRIGIDETKANLDKIVRTNQMNQMKSNCYVTPNVYTHCQQGCHDGRDVM